MSVHTLPSKENTDRVFRMDDTIHDLLMHSAPEPPEPPQLKRATLPEPVFPQYPELLNDPVRMRHWKSGSGRASRFTARCAVGCSLISARVCFPATSIPSRLICLPITSAISIAGTAGHSIAGSVE